MDFFWIVFGTGYIIHVLCKEKFGAGPLTILLGLLIRDDPKKVPHWNMPNEKVPRWTEDEFVEHCTTPLFPAKIIDNNDTEALYNLGLSSGETVEYLVEHHSDFRNMSHSYRFFEVYKKNDGTFYAWPCRASLNRILKGNMNCYQGTYIREQKGYGIPYRREEYYETSVDLLRFYFEMPELTFVDKSVSTSKQASKQVENPGVWFRLARGSKPMILERVYDLDPKMHGNMHGREYMYKPVSKGELRIFIVKRNGDNGSEFK